MASSVMRAILSRRPTETGRNLALRINREFLRMLVIERSLYYATIDIYDGESY
jgi:hypothetical protein